jgi:C-terminal processing protease CtpA/Prc
MKNLILFFGATMLFSSCEKFIFQDDLSSLDPHENFDYLWNECNEKYTYFELKGVDWNQVRDEYRALLYKGMSEDSLFAVLSGMLNELKDDHANLFSSFNTSFYGAEFAHSDNFEWRTVVDYYITDEYLITGPFSHNFIQNNQIGYVRYNSFANTIQSAQLDYILNRYKDAEGLIIDVRDNGGGAIANVFKLLERFAQEQTKVYSSVIKNGPGPNDFSEAVPAIVTPYDGIRYTSEVVILTDRGTYSSGSLLALAARALPNLTLIGDSTGGGLGIPNGGQLPNGWNYRFSITRTLDLQNNAAFENGVPADIPSSFDWNDLTTDEILEDAIDYLL